MALPDPQQGNDGSCYEFWTPPLRRSHQYHRLNWPSNPERFCLTKFERTPDSSVNVSALHNFIEKEHWTRRWSIQFSAIRLSSWDIKVDSWKAWIYLICDFKRMNSFSGLCDGPAQGYLATQRWPCVSFLLFLNPTFLSLPLDSTTSG